jgi:hypothetical protein
MDKVDIISFVLSMILTNEIAVETAVQTYTFLTHLLSRYTTSESWTNACTYMYTAAEQYHIGATRLPYLNLSSRAAAKREQKKWSRYIYQLTNEYPNVSKRVHSANFHVKNALF